MASKIAEYSNRAAERANALPSSGSRSHMRPMILVIRSRSNSDHGVPKLCEQRVRKCRQRLRAHCRGRGTGRCRHCFTAAIPNAQLACNAVKDLTRPVRLTHEIVHSRRQDVASLAGKYRRGDCCDLHLSPAVERSDVSGRL